MVREILQLLFPLLCLVCDSPGNELCKSCRLKIAPKTRYREKQGTRYWAGAEYGEELAKIILLAKEQNNSLARNFLADLIVQTFMAASREFDTRNSLFIPIPSSNAANRKRGYRHAHLLAQIAAAKIDKSTFKKVVVKESLRVNRTIADQSNLNKAERVRNLSGAYSFINHRKSGRSDLKGYSIFLIDDLVTTGSSAEEGLRALQMAGFAPYGVLSAGVSLGVSVGVFS